MCGVKGQRFIVLFKHIESVGFFLKSLYDYYSLPAKRVLAISQWQTFLKSFTHKMAAKASLHQNYVAVTLCIVIRRRYY